MRRSLSKSHVGIMAVVIAMLLVAAAPAFACTSILVGKDASVDGSVMTSHTCDGTYEFRLNVIPAKDWPAGAMRPIIKGGGSGAHAAPGEVVGEIPQVAHTYQYFDIAYPFGNEYGVLMGETTIGGRRELANPDGYFEIWELQRLGLERGRTAREVVQIMGELAEEYGYGDSGECLTVHDGDEAWFFEIFGAGPFKKGALWAAVRVPDDEIAVSANRSKIGELKVDDPNYMFSPNAFTLAEEFGWWSHESGEPFIWQDIYGPKLSYYNSRREWRVFSMLAPSLNLDPWDFELPWSIKPDKKVSVADIAAIKRDHYEGTEFDLTKGPAAGPFGNPNRYATPATLGEWERAISMFRCSYSIITQGRGWLPPAIGNVVWFGEDAPHSTTYVPFYAAALSVPKSFTVGNRNIFDRDCAWWAFNYVSNYADLKYSYMIKDIQAVQQRFENEAFAMQPAVEKAALELYRKDPSLAITFLTNYSNNFAERVVDAYWGLADLLIVKYQDGYVNLKTVGYPEEWLKAVGFKKLVKPEGK